jgi:3-oxoacyl-[acyl-carrier protein] reductase
MAPNLKVLSTSRQPHLKKDACAMFVSNNTPSDGPIIVMERWHLKSEVANNGLTIMQEMDRLLETSTHEHPGWCGHASFYQSNDRPSEIIIVYPWRSRDLHAELMATEEPLLYDFQQEFCASTREVHYYSQL